MNVVIYIKEVENSSGRVIRVLWRPDVINIDTGSASMVSYDILNVGEVVKPTGVGLSKYSWESIFPGVYRDPGIITTAQEPFSPKHYDDILKYWMKNKTKLRLLVTGYPINVDVYLTSYTSKASGGFGDIEYSVTFTEARDITIKSTKYNVQTSKPTLKRSAPSTSNQPYEVKAGDTLWSIAQAKLGSGMNWYTIYTKNKVVIENAAKAHKKASSNNGHWIYPGTILLIP
jgi:LysM repeat protein